MQRAVRRYLKALEASDIDKAAALFTADGWVQSPFLGRLPVRDYIAKVAGRIEFVRTHRSRCIGERRRADAGRSLLSL